MSDVYVAFVRDDQVYAESLAVALQGSGFAVSRSPSVVEAINECPAIVVLWSPAAARSKLFMDAADRAFRSGKMVLARMGSDPLPAIFAGVEVHPLSRWTGDPEAADLDAIVFHVDRLVSRARLQIGQEYDRSEAEAHSARLHAARGVVHRFPGGAQTGRAPQPQPQHQPQPQPAHQQPPPQMRQPPLQPHPPMAPPISAQPPQPHQQYAPPPRAPIQAPPSDPLPVAQPAPPPQDPLAAEAAHWRRIQHSLNPDDFYAYLERYGSSGAFAELAEARIRSLAPPPAPVQRPVHQAPLGQPPLSQQPLAPPPFGGPSSGYGIPAPRPLAPQEGIPARTRISTAPPPLRANPGLDPHPARSRYDAAEPEPQSRGGGGARGLIFLVLIGALLAGGFYIYTAINAPVKRVTGASRGDIVEPRRPTSSDYESPPEADASTIDSGASVSALEAPPATTVTSGPSKSATRAPLAAPAPRPAPRRPSGSDPNAAEMYRQLQEATPAPVIRTIPNTPPATSPAPSNDGPSDSPGGQRADSGGVRLASVTAPAPAGFVRPIWSSRPSAQDVAAVYPAHARDGGVKGRAVLECVIRVAPPTPYTLGCNVASESPSNEGFGEAALKLARQFQASPYLEDGSPSAGQRTLVQIAFEPR